MNQGLCVIGKCSRRSRSMKAIDYFQRVKYWRTGGQGSRNQPGQSRLSFSSDDSLGKPNNICNRRLKSVERSFLLQQVPLWVHSLALCPTVQNEEYKRVIGRRWPLVASIQYNMDSFSVNSLKSCIWLSSIRQKSRLNKLESLLRRPIAERIRNGRQSLRQNCSYHLRHL